MQHLLVRQFRNSANMADSQLDTTVMLTTNSKILVTVDEALQDVIVVSYAFESKLFQGVLLDSTKKYLPCRISNPEKVSQLANPKTDTSEEEKLYFSIRQRFTYFQEKPVHLNHFHLQKKLSTKSKSQKMTVRLRPRQVLCSKCKSICNENSENVNSHMTRSKKPEIQEDSPPRPLFSENRRDNQLPNASPPKLCPSFIPRIPRMQHSEINTAINGSGPITRSSEEFWFKPPEAAQSVKEGDEEEEDERQMVLRKKRSVGSMEDLWDETVFEEGSKKAKTTPVIKISFGSQGEGTVLKIPSKVQACSESEAEEKPTAVQEAKAAKKAMKKAKKEAKRKTSRATPPRSAGNISPKAETPQYKKHRHKVKHKKKHKTDKIDDEMKERCLKQKLSINLKRVSSTSYEKAEESSGGEASPNNEEIPDFPAATPITETTRDVHSCKTEDGTTLAVGDIVWGKIHGFPWWPGKVLNILIRTDRNSWDAHVSWFGSTTSSLMPCDQLSPFLQTFKVRYNRRKKSAGYKEAIRLATSEASASNPDLGNILKTTVEA